MNEMPRWDPQLPVWDDPCGDLERDLVAARAEIEALRYTVSQHRLVQADLDAARAEVEALRQEVGRWRLARRYLTPEEILSWTQEGGGWEGHQPSEEQSVKADSAADAALAREQEEK